MTSKMLIDASHPEETRVVVLKGSRLEEFDFEAASKRPLRGNIYLAKVTRVEPSLQACFVEYGGNRQAFLPFSEIHPDYYQIPVADREALLAEEALAQQEDDDDEPRRGGSRSGSSRSESQGGSNGGQRRSRRHRQSAEGGTEPSEAMSIGQDATDTENGQETGLADIQQDMHHLGLHEPELDGQQNQALDNEAQEPDGPDHLAKSHSVNADDHVSEAVGEEVPAEEKARTGDTGEHIPAWSSADDQSWDGAPEAPEGLQADNTVLQDYGQPGSNFSSPSDEPSAEEPAALAQEPSTVGQMGGDGREELPRRTQRARRHYQIQEVIKRRQVLLIQVVKEERGGKGAAVTTYLSLAGRYSVLMPNSGKGGGISRKITDEADRKRLKSIVQELEVPEGMGIILRTAGATRTRQELRRDFEYLLRMWETVRELTLKSSAPTLVYEEGSLIKRSIRDLYNGEMGEILVAGENGFREARDFMRLLMPGNVKDVKLYQDSQPLFAKSGVEPQLDAMFSSHVTLKSGGYIVINQTEALVAIDVNSGRSTREHNIEDTALRTNLEAADEVARQLRLRDLAGLIVVDFIDMEESRNNRAVERRMKDALKDDRARIQVGHISHFGLLEMSRQRMRTGVFEGSTIPCPHCTGTGMVRSTSSIALVVLRALEDSLIKSATHNLILHCRTDVALYILNQKRLHLHELEQRFGVTIIINADTSLTGTTYHALERTELAVAPPSLASARGLVQVDSVMMDDLVDEEVDNGETDDEGEIGDMPSIENRPGSRQEGVAIEGESGEETARRRRRRRRRRGGRDREGSTREGVQNASLNAESELQYDAEGVLIQSEQPDAQPDLSETPDASAQPSSDENSSQERPAGRGRDRNRHPWRSRRRGADEAGTIPATQEGNETGTDEPLAEPAQISVDDAESDIQSEGAAQETPRRRPRRSRSTKVATADEPVAKTVEPAAIEAPMAEAMPAPVIAPAPVADVSSPPPAAATPDPNAPKRTGWWQRAKASLGGG